MRYWLGMLCLCAGWVATAAHADGDAGRVATALRAIDSAKAVAKAGRGSLLMVGSILSPQDDGSDSVVVVLDYPGLDDLKPGMVLILAKNDCEPIDQCLIARRVTGSSAGDGVETEPYGGAEGLLLTQIKATLLGSVAYAVDLHTGAIRNLRADGACEVLTVAEAIGQEEARAGSTDRPAKAVVCDRRA